MEHEITDIEVEAAERFAAQFGYLTLLAPLARKIINAQSHYDSWVSKTTEQEALLSNQSRKYQDMVARMDELTNQINAKAFAKLEELKLEIASRETQLAQVNEQTAQAEVQLKAVTAKVDAAVVQRNKILSTLGS